MKNRIEKLNGVGKRKDDGGSMKSQRVVKTQPKVKKNVSFDEDGNVYRLIERKRGLVLSDASESSNGDDEVVVEEIGVSKENGVEEEEEDSSEMSENEMDPRKNLGTRIYQTSKTNQPGQEEEDEEEDGDDFVFSAPLPAKMEYRVDSVSKKQAAKH
ncbi:BAG family molecular chaperone regulator 8, chloroplastic [Tanacetum coccineum]